MREVWLKSNRRVFLTAMSFPLAGVLAGAAVGVWGVGWLAYCGWGLAACALVLLALLATVWRRPILAIDGPHLLVYLQSGGPERIPIDLVEVFFRGEGPIQPSTDDDGPHAANIVIRLAERAEEWKHREVKRALGQWCDGYITIRGMWCEPIDLSLMENLNKRLVTAHRNLRQRKADA